MNPNAVELIGKRVPVLDWGFVELVDVMGDDDAIAAAARVSYKGAKRKNISTTEQLIDYLVRHRHTSPLEMGEMKFVCKLPIFVARQWIRHRTASVNELSGRYSELEPEYYEPSEWRGQDTVNKQGSTGLMKLPDGLEGHREQRLVNTWSDYKTMINVGVAKEMARIDLPLSTYTEWYWKQDVHNLLHLLKLRLDPHAQWEIRQYAAVIEDMVKACFPVTYATWVNHVRDAVTFSADEMACLLSFLNTEVMGEGDNYSVNEVLRADYIEKLDLSQSRKAEFKAKLGIKL